ncbi:hypothetical protein D3C78_756130 [compost metagenome]
MIASGKLCQRFADRPNYSRSGSIAQPLFSRFRCNGSQKATSGHILVKMTGVAHSSLSESFA